MKIGILGGTFDPIHIGHLKLAEAALDQLSLDKVVFMPCFIPPHKTRTDIAPPGERLEMVKMAIEGFPSFELSDYEIARSALTFSSDMLKAFKKARPDDEIFFIMGSDSYKELDSWKDGARIGRIATVAVAQRPGHEFSSPKNSFAEIKIDPLPISSSGVRDRIKRGESIHGLVTDPVEAFIAKRNLYR